MSSDKVWNFHSGYHTNDNTVNLVMHREERLKTLHVNKQIRGGKIMLYNADTGKRVKEPRVYITWAHKVLKLKDFNFKSCLFGEHLLKEYPEKTISIVESEKSAIIADTYYPHMLWLASGSLSNISDNMLLPVKERNIILWPDAGKAYQIWYEKAEYLVKLGYDVRVSDFLERFTTDMEKDEGIDLADYFLKDHTLKQRIDSYIKDNPSYIDCCEAFGIPLGEPVVLESCPF